MDYYDFFFFFFSSRRRHTRFDCDWSSDVCSSDLISPAKHSRERPRVLESSSLQNPLYKRVCVTAICQDNFPRGLRKKSVENSMARRLILGDPRPKVISKRTAPSERVAFHTARIPH